MKPNPKEFRIDASAKICGDARYIADEKIPGMWYGTTIRSLHARARILDIRFDPQFDWQSVVVVTARDIPNNYVAMLENDMPVLADTMVNYVGEPVLLIAAHDKNLLAQARHYVIVDYEPLPYVLNMLESETSGIHIYGSNNVFKEIRIEKGNLDQAQQQADNVIEIETHTGFQEHVYLEPQGMLAIPEQDRVIVWGSMQCPYYIKNALVQMFAGNKHITVIQATTGGAFGGKEDFPSLLAGHAALLAVKSDQPVLMVYDRSEDVQYTPKRHPSYCRSRAYVNQDGQLLGLDLQLYLDGGAYCTLSQVVLARAALTATGCYYIPNVRIHAKAVATNTVPSGAFRGFGGPQVIFAIEILMEKIARVLDQDPDQTRQNNLIEAGQETATGQVLKYSVSARQTFEDVCRQGEFRKKYYNYLQWNQNLLKKIAGVSYSKRQAKDVLKGIGISASVHGAGFTGTGENKIQGRIRLVLDADGQVTIYSAQTEMGQGQQTVFRQIVADALQIELNQVNVAEVNTDLVPDSGPTVASRSTMVIGSLLVDAAQTILQRLTENLKTDDGSDFDYRQGYFCSNDRILPFVQVAKNYPGLEVEKCYHHPPIIQFDDINWRGDAYPVYSWAATVAEIEVDPVTFEIKVVRVYTSHDIGKAINYSQAEAQIQGGLLQGIGYALYEKIGLENARFDVTGFSDYIIPTTTEMPEFHIHILENPYPFGPSGAKGLGELPAVGVAPAIISALWMIFNKEFNKIPILPEDIFCSLKNKNK